MGLPRQIYGALLYEVLPYSDFLWTEERKTANFMQPSLKIGITRPLLFVL
jgi:hypothetical protein